jgi:hypothetical protein
MTQGNDIVAKITAQHNEIQKLKEENYRLKLTVIELHKKNKELTEKLEKQEETAH